MALVTVYNNKFKWILIVLFILFIIGISSFMRIQVRDEEKRVVQETLNKGNYIVSLLSMNPLETFNSDRRQFITKTLAEHISSEGLVYCIIHDRKGETLLSLMPKDLAAKIPYDIQKRSIYSMGLIRQTFQLVEGKKTIYEFAKPIFENGEKNGTVRLGFDIPQVSYFAMNRITLMAMIAFFTLATGAIIYYGTAYALTSVRDVFQKSDSGKSKFLPSEKIEQNYSGIIPIIQDLEQSFNRIKEELSNTEEDNIKMASKLGVVVFEKNRISKIIDSIDIGIIITDVHENIININAYMLNLLKMERDDVINHSLNDILNNEDINNFISQPDIGKPSQDLKRIETTFPDVAPGRTYRVSMTYLRENEGSVISNMITIKDITEQKSMEKASQGFIAQVAHEFLTPLTTIGSYNEMLMDGEIEDREMQKEFYNTISEETTRLTRLIQNLLSIAKIEMGGLTLNKGLVKTDWLIEDSISSVDGAAIKKNIRIVKNLPDNLPSLVGDKELLKIGIINILGNAVKYSGENGTITLSLLEQDNSVIFTISDTGFGISKEDLPHIFDKFYRSKESHISEQTGSGLGLAMTAEIIHLHGGEIEVQSEPGHGTEFTIFIPKEEYYLGT